MVEDVAQVAEEGAVEEAEEVDAAGAVVEVEDLEGKLLPMTERYTILESCSH